jgi:adenylate kinase
MRKYVIMGIQGSGKGTQAKLLCEVYDLVHLSVGDIFRWNVQYHTKVGAQVRRTMAAGELVDDGLVERLVQERLAMHDWNYGFIVDGFPRNARQAEFFLESYDIDAVIQLDMPDEEVMRRVMARRLCSGCGLDYNLIAHRPKLDDTCDVCGARLVSREDDNPEALAARLRDYHDKTRPILELFEQKEFVISADATQSVEAVHADLRAELDLTTAPQPNSESPQTPSLSVVRDTDRGPEL